MNVVFFGNHRVAWDVLCFLVGTGAEIVWETLSGDRPPSNTELSALEPDIGVSVMYPHILSVETVRLFPCGVVNLHPALLPYCRGKHPVFWAMREGLPAGSTLHYIDVGVDTGDVIAQRHVPYTDDDVCSFIYDRCVQTGRVLFKTAWGSIVDGTARRVRQLERKATFHYGSEVHDPDYWFGRTAKEIRDGYGK